MAYTYAKPTKKIKAKSSTKKEDKYNPKSKDKKGKLPVANTLCLVKGS